MKTFGGRDWQKTLWWLSGSGLPHYFLARLRRVHREYVLPPAILCNLSQNFCANQLRVKVMAEEFVTLNRRLNEGGVPYAAMRGFELAPEYCPVLSLRTWYAHEYFVPDDAVREASKILEQAGYPFRRTGPRGELIFSVDGLQTPSRLEDTYTAAFPRMVVLHWQVWDRNGTGINVTQPIDVLQRLVTHRSQGGSFPTLSENDLLAFTLMDTFVRVLGYWCKLSWFFELSNFLQVRYADANFWEGFYARIAEYGKLPEIADFVFLLCSNLFEVELPEAVGMRVSGLKPALILWTHRYGKEWALSKYPGSKLSLLVQHEMIDDRETWKGIRRRKLLPFLPGRAVLHENLATTNHERRRRTLSQVVDRIRFHGPATLAYLRQLPRWKRLLSHGS